MATGFLEGTHKKIKSGSTLLFLCLIVGGGAYTYSGSTVIGIVSAVIVIIIFFVWYISDRVNKIEKEVDALKNRRK